MIFTTLNLFAQLPAEQEKNAGYRKELFGGLMLHSQGWGLTSSFTKFNTYKKRRLYTLDFISIKDPKEIKMTMVPDRSAKKVVYGKLNYVYNLRFGIGTKKTLYEPLRENGIKISTVASVGPTLSFVKPVYLEVFKILGPEKITKVVEKYDPNVHSYYDIYGRASFGYGLKEMKVNPGVNLKLGLNFEKEIETDVYRMIEVGAAVDAFYKSTQIMYLGRKNYVFATIYLNLLLSKKYY